MFTPNRHQHKIVNIIIGAGAAGLSAARQLSRHGLGVTILARNGLGGRIFHDTRGQNRHRPFERGAEFVNGEPAETLDIARAAGLNLNWLPDTHRHSKMESYTIARLLGKLATLRKDTSRATSRTSRAYSLHEYLQHRKLDAESRLLVQTMSRVPRWTFDQN